MTAATEQQKPSEPEKKENAPPKLEEKLVIVGNVVIIL
jgi:hypothetical protein